MEYFDFEDFKNLQYVTFSQLQILKFTNGCPNQDYLTRFLEINGKNLKEFHLDTSNHSTNLAITKYYSNLKSLYTIFQYDEVETLKLIFNGYQKLQDIKVRYRDYSKQIVTSCCKMFT